MRRQDKEFALSLHAGPGRAQVRAIPESNIDMAPGVCLTTAVFVIDQALTADVCVVGQYPGWTRLGEIQGE